MTAPEGFGPSSRLRASALHDVDVLNRDGSAIAVEHDEDRQSDRGFGGRDRQHDQGEDLAGDVAQMGREGDEVDVDGEQDQLDRHQDDDHVLAVEKDAENAEREQHGGDGQVVVQPDHADSLNAFAEGHLADLDRSLLGAADLLRDVLPLDAGPIAQGEDDRADHRHEQDQAGGLEEVEILRVEDAPDRLGVGERLADRHSGSRRVDVRRVDRPGADDEQQFHQEHEADQ